MYKVTETLISNFLGEFSSRQNDREMIFSLTSRTTTNRNTNNLIQSEQNEINIPMNVEIRHLFLITAFVRHVNF